MGQIVGTGLHNGNLQAFILTPVSETSQPLPLGPKDSTVVWGVPEDWTPPDGPENQTADTSNEDEADDSADSEDPANAVDTNDWNDQVITDRSESVSENFFTSMGSAIIGNDMLVSPDPLASITTAQNRLW